MMGILLAERRENPRKETGISSGRQVNLLRGGVFFALIILLKFKIGLKVMSFYRLSVYLPPMFGSESGRN